MFHKDKDKKEDLVAMASEKLAQKYGEDREPWRRMLAGLEAAEIHTLLRAENLETSSIWSRVKEHITA